MSAFLAFRRVHKWVSLAAALPLVLIFATGVLLSASSKIAFLQPRPAPVPSPGISLSFDRVLEAARAVEGAGIASWDDVVQIDVRPKSGVIRVRAKNYWEVQLDGRSGRVLAAAPRRKTMLILLHEGSWFAPWVKTWIFLPAGIAALVLWISGIALWLIPTLKKRGKA